MNVFILAKRLSEVLSSPRQSLRNAAEGSYKKVLPGVVVTSSRSSRRRISSVAATQAFAVATSGESPKITRNERLASTAGVNFDRPFLIVSLAKNVYFSAGNTNSTPLRTTSNHTLSSNARETKPNDQTIVNTASTMRVLNVIRHWLTKHPMVNFKEIFSIKKNVDIDRYFRIFTTIQS